MVAHPQLWNLLVHWYSYAESYTFILVCLVIPLGYWACYRFFKNNFGMFAAPEKTEVMGKRDHG